MRNTRLRIAVGLVLTLVLVLAGLALSAGSAPGRRLRSGPVRVAAGTVAPSVQYVRGSALYRPGRARTTLAAQAEAPLAGSLAPVAVPSADGRLLAYDSWADLRRLDHGLSLSRQGIEPGEPVGTPSLRVFDTATGRDSLLERGAYSAAFRADGALAYVRGREPAFRPGEPYLGEVVVRSSLRAVPEVWSDVPGHYVVYGWAGARLLVYRVGDDEQLATFVLDGPGRVRLLSQGSVVAVSPDGTRVLVLDPDNRHVRVLRVADGGELASLDPAAEDGSIQWVAYSGSWEDDEVVAPASPGLVVFRVGGDSISVEQVLALDENAFPVGVQEPVFADGARSRIVATAILPPQGAAPAETELLDCDRVSRSCLRGEPAPAAEWLRVVRNPSRPLGSGR